MLYTLTNQAVQLQSMLESGMIDEECFNDTIENLGAEWNCEIICKMIQNIKAESEALKTEKKRLEERAKSADNAVDRLKEELKGFLEASKQTSLEAGTFKVSLRKNPPSVDVPEDYLGLPDIYLLLQPPKVNKTKIKEDLKAGIAIPGCKLVTDGTSVTIK